jgi:hypothetical protein
MEDIHQSQRDQLEGHLLDEDYGDCQVEKATYEEGAEIQDVLGSVLRLDVIVEDLECLGELLLTLCFIFDRGLRNFLHRFTFETGEESCYECDDSQNGHLGYGLDFHYLSDRILLYYVDDYYPKNDSDLQKRELKSSYEACVESIVFDF